MRKDYANLLSIRNSDIRAQKTNENVTDPPRNSGSRSLRWLTGFFVTVSERSWDSYIRTNGGQTRECIENSIFTV
jgi:hypothetical protein